MKRLLIFSFSLILVSGAYALEFKFIGGSNLSRYIIFPEEYYNYWGSTIKYSQKSSYKPGFLLGAGVELSLAKNVAIEIDGLYFRKGSEVKSFYNDILYEKKNYVLNVVSLPVLIKIKFLPDSSPYILHGGELSYILSHKYKRIPEGPGDTFAQGETQNDTYVDMKDETKSFSFGVVVGGGFEIKAGGISFFIEARYHFGLINIVSENHDDKWYRFESINTVFDSYSLQSMKANSQVVLFGLKISD